MMDLSAQYYLARPFSTVFHKALHYCLLACALEIASVSNLRQQDILDPTSSHAVLPVRLLLPFTTAPACCRTYYVAYVSYAFHYLDY